MKLLTLLQTAALVLLAGVGVYAGTFEPVLSLAQ